MYESSECIGVIIGGAAAGAGLLLIAAARARHARLFTYYAKLLRAGSLWTLSETFCVRLARVLMVVTGLFFMIAGLAAVMSFFLD